MKADPMADAVLITGADGYLGSRLARRYLEAGADRVILWMRATDREEARAKAERLGATTARFPERVELVFGDLEDPAPFAAVDQATVKSIVHAAAVTRFNVDQETADRVNVGGTRKLLDFARRCAGLERLGLLSTVYVSGTKPGAFGEEPLAERPEFANHYERSKWEAETLLVRDHASLPWLILRVATVITDDDSGAVVQQNAFHNTLKLLYYGLLSLIPGRADTPLYLVTGRFVTESAFALMDDREARGVFHLAHRREESLTLGELIATAFETFERDDGFRSRRILKPMFADEEAFRLLVEGVTAFGGGVVNQAVSSVAPFARQLFVCKEIDNRRLRGALAAYRAPDAKELVESACGYLVRTRWAREVESVAG